MPGMAMAGIAMSGVGVAAIASSAAAGVKAARHRPASTARGEKITAEYCMGLPEISLL